MLRSSPHGSFATALIHFHLAMVKQIFGFCWQLPYHKIWKCYTWEYWGCSSFRGPHAEFQQPYKYEHTDFIKSLEETLYLWNSYQVISYFSIIKSFIVIQPHLSNPYMVFEQDFIHVPTPGEWGRSPEDMAHMRTRVNLHGATTHPCLKILKADDW